MEVSSSHQLTPSLCNTHSIAKDQVKLTASNQYFIQLFTGYGATAPATAPVLEYGGFKPCTSCSTEALAVAPAVDYGVTAAPVTNYQVPAASQVDDYGTLPASNYEAPAVAAPSHYGSGASVQSSSSQLKALPLPATGIKLDTPVQSFLSESAGTGPQAKSFDSDNSYDPFVFQGLGEEIGENISASLENNQPEANRNKGANKVNTGILQANIVNQKPASSQNPSFNQPLVFGSFQNGNVNRNEVFDPFGLNKGFGGKIPKTRQPVRVQTTRPATRRPSSTLQQQFNQQAIALQQGLNPPPNRQRPTSSPRPTTPPRPITPPRPSGFPPASTPPSQNNPNTFFAASITPQQRKTTQRTTARTTPRRRTTTQRTNASTSQQTTRKSVLIQQATLSNNRIKNWA